MLLARYARLAGSFGQDDEFRAAIAALRAAFSSSVAFGSPYASPTAPNAAASSTASWAERARSSAAGVDLHAGRACLRDPHRAVARAASEARGFHRVAGFEIRAVFSDPVPAVAFGELPLAE